MGRSNAMSRRLLYGGVALFFVLFFFMPIGTVFVEAFGGMSPGRLLSVVGETLRSSKTLSILRFTVGQAALSAAIGVLLALPLAYLISHFRFPGRRFLYSLSLIPFVLPSIIVVVCMISFYGKSGLINTILGTDFNLVYSFRGIVLAHVFYDFSLAIRVIATSWRSIDKRYRESAESLGESKTGLFFRVTLPLLAPAIVTGFALVFIYTFLSFGIVLVFGGVQFATLEVAIYREMFVDLNLSSAAVYSLLQLALSAGFLAISTRTLRTDRGAGLGNEAELPRLRDAANSVRWPLGIFAGIMVIFVLGPILTMIGRAFVNPDGSLSLENFRQLLFPRTGERNVESILRSSVGGVIARSLGIAAASGTVTFAAATALSLTRRGKAGGWTEALLQLPIGMSLVTVSLGLRLLWTGVIPATPLIIAGQFFVAFPLVFRIVRTGVEELPGGQVQAARILGASRWRVFADVEFPLLKRTLLNAYAYALALPFADLTVVLAAGQGRIATFPVAIYRLIGFRSFDLALALASIYIGICLVLFLIIDRTSLRRRSMVPFGGARAAAADSTQEQPA
ncbi:MAG: ABC transporter permease [Spirochaetota bacterium]